MESRAAVESDVPGILTLQKMNLQSELGEEERKNGFVTTPFTKEQIVDRIENSGLFVSEDQGQIVAYVFAGKWKFFEQWPIFPFMTARFPKLAYKNFDVTVASTFQYGPVCVDMNYRGIGTFNRTFEVMRHEWMRKFPLAITFINSVNEVSVRAHRKLGWEEIDQFNYNDNQYLTLAFDMGKSVV